MIKIILLIIAGVIDDCAEDISWWFTVGVCVLTLNDWIRSEHADFGMALILAAIVFLLLFPILEGVFSILMIVPRIICHFALWAYKRYYGINDDWEEGEWKKENREQQESGNQHDRKGEGNSKQKQKNTGFGRSSSGDIYKEAVQFFGLNEPFSEKELKEKYRNCMKKIHPDAGGSTEEAQKANRYYTYLKAFCS